VTLKKAAATRLEQRAGTDGLAGTVENVWLDEAHGLRISIRGHYGKWPISTIKFAEDY
jgi:hypothetical protein